MKIRTGRRNGRNLYLQVGNEASDTDPCLGFISNPTIAALIVEAVNDQGSDYVGGVTHIENIADALGVIL